MRTIAAFHDRVRYSIDDMLGSAPEPEAGPDPSDLRATLAAAIGSGDESASGEVPTESAAVEEKAAPAVDGRARNPDGTYAANPVEATQAPVAVADPAKVDATPVQAPAAPLSFNDAAKAEWAKVPAVVQQAITKRELEVNQGFAAKAQEHQQVLQPAAHFANLFSQQAGRRVAPAEVINEWAMVQDRLLKDPVEGLKFIAQAYKVDLSALAPQQQAAQDEWQDPALKALESRFAPVLSEIGQVKTWIQQQEQARIAHARQQEEAATESAAQAVQNFAAATGSDGQPLRPHFAAVQDDILDILPSVRRSMPGATNEAILEAAYDRAVYANPTVRVQVLAAQQAKQQREEQQRQQQVAAAAKGASVSVRGAPGGASANTPAASVADELRRALGA